MSREILSLGDQVRHKPACSATETSWNLEILDISRIDITLSRHPCSLISAFIGHIRHKCVSHDVAHKKSV